MTEQKSSGKYSLALANEIKSVIEEHLGELADNVFIIGSIAEKGYSNNDIDLVITLATIEGEIKPLIVHLVKEVLKNKGFPIENIDLYCYTRYCVYNATTRFQHPFY